MIISLGSIRFNLVVVVPSRRARVFRYSSQKLQIAGQYFCPYFCEYFINSCGEEPRSVARPIKSRNSLAKPRVVRAGINSFGQVPNSGSFAKFCASILSSSVINASCSAPESNTYLLSSSLNNLSFKIKNAME